MTEGEWSFVYLAIPLIILLALLVERAMAVGEDRP
jgi:hypothetical protein